MIGQGRETKADDLIVEMGEVVYRRKSRDPKGGIMELDGLEQQ